MTGPYIARTENTPENFVAAIANPFVIRVRVNRHNVLVVYSTAPVEFTGAAEGVIAKTAVGTFVEHEVEHTAYGAYPVTHRGTYELHFRGDYGKVYANVITRFTRNGIIVGGGSAGGAHIARTLAEIGFTREAEAFA